LTYFMSNNIRIFFSKEEVDIFNSNTHVKKIVKVFKKVKWIFDKNCSVEDEPRKFKSEW
jgi:hypothetical protein